MRKLHSFKLCPFSRKVRVAMAEKRLTFSIIEEKFWDNKKNLLQLNPAGQVPVFIETNGYIISDSTAIVSYLDKVYKPNSLISKNPYLLAETYRLNAWFDTNFYEEITKPVLHEKLMKRLSKKITSDKYGKDGTKALSPNAKAIFSAQQKMQKHFKYLNFLLDSRNWLTGDDFSLADITAASHVACLDYLFAINWQSIDQSVKDWYAKIKSRKSFEAILNDKLPILAPPPHYKNPDFN